MFNVQVIQNFISSKIDVFIYLVQGNIYLQKIDTTFASYG